METAAAACLEPYVPRGNSKGWFSAVHWFPLFDSHPGCMKKLEGVLPLMRKAQIDMSTWRWSSSGAERMDEWGSLAECCQVFRDTISTKSRQR